MVRPKRNNPDVEEFDDPLKNYDDKVYADDLERALVENHATAMKTTPVETVQTSATIGDVVKLMAERNIASVLVVAGDRLAGIFSERDVLNRVAENFDEIKDNPVSEVMTPDPLAIYDTDSPAKAMNIMATGGFRHVPIIDVDERVVGIVGPRRVTKFLMEQRPTG